ncbi:MAG: hypothetical protein QOJ07_944, partial [Thermoleophilaceae bacterium]|nr:hypothetical protein [Thermoleophilaceae bacterium]
MAPPATAQEALDAYARMTEAEDALRAIGAGEVDAFVVTDGSDTRRVFTLSTADKPYRTFVENMRDGAATISRTGLILYANRRLSELLLCARETIVGAPLARFVGQATPIDIEHVLGVDGRGATLEVDLLDCDGGVVAVLMGSSPLAVDNEDLVCLTFADISTQKAQDREIARLGEVQADRLADLQEAQAALVVQATHDALTGLPNRAVLVRSIEQGLAQTARSGGAVAVLFIDLDRFKQVNDSQGHAAGDAVLRDVAGRLVAATRPMDTVARIGGDEFVVFAAEVDSQSHAVDMGTRLVRELGRRPAGTETGKRMPASIGVSVSIGGRATAEALLTQADHAMYQAKALGGERAEVFDVALRRKARERSLAQTVLGSALDEDRIIAHYQPIVELASGAVAGLEALARIAGRDGAVLPPATFVPGAEDSGLVVPLGARVLEIACREACGWQRPDASPAVAVNLSARQFDPGDLTTVIGETLERTGLDPEHLHLEITETALIDLDPDFLQQLVQIRNLGVEIGLDDFGTGYASLTHLRALPVTFVKIDQSFVAGLCSNE